MSRLELLQKNVKFLARMKPPSESRVVVATLLVLDLAARTPKAAKAVQKALDPIVDAIERHQSLGLGEDRGFWVDALVEAVAALEAEGDSGAQAAEAQSLFPEMPMPDAYGGIVREKEEKPKKAK